MANWKYTLPNSKDLRNAIEEDDSLLTLRQIRVAYKFIKERTGFNADEEEMWDLEECINRELKDEEVVNYYLEMLYDICDTLHIWIEA